MLPFRKKIKLSQEDQYWIFIIVVYVGFISFITPTTVWNTKPATGGDTGSHFYPLWVLVNESLPHWQIRTWNPGNLMGEPHLLHYFPGPFLLMAFLSIFMPLGLAFNLGTILPLVAFPLSMAFALSKLSASFLTRITAIAACFLALFNESYSMWGGNATSLLAGQYAHLYAVNLLFITIGLIASDLRKPHSYWAGLTTGLIALCHTYIFLLLPFVFLGFIAKEPSQNIRKNFFYFVKIGCLGLLLTAWFVIPQAMHGSWMTGNAMKWEFSNAWKELLPINFRPLIALFLLSLPATTFWLGKNRLDGKVLGKEVLFWLIPLASCIVMFFIFPKFGLVDVRAVPQINFIFCILTAIFFTQAIKPLRRDWQVGLVAIFVIFCLFWVKKNMVNYPYWVQWNYSSWEAKPKWKDALKLFENLKGDFNQPRIANEHNPSLNDVGTTRVFESLPLFAGRANMESLYQEANQMSPFTYLLQARISKQPSCPIRGWDCTSMNFENIDPLLKILGVKDLILVSDDAKAAVIKNPHLQKTGSFGMFEVWSLNQEVPLVEVLQTEPTTVSMKNYQRVFYDWILKSINDPEPPKYLLVNPQNSHMNARFEPQDCKPSLTVDYNRLSLQTNCPGFLHLIKFAYHPTFQADSGDDLYMLSPGFIGIVPSKENINFKFGNSWIWLFSSVVSLLTFAGFCWHQLKTFFKR